MRGRRAIGEIRVVEEYFDKFYRVIMVERDGERLYSIDVYIPIEKLELSCSMTLENEHSNAKLCYTDIGGGCTGVILGVNENMEIINLRYLTRVDEDPFTGNLSKARDFCLGRLQEWLNNKNIQVKREG